MMDNLDAIRSLDDLRTFIHQVLCDRENILRDQFGLSETKLVRSGRVCGVQFSLKGPRSIRLGAIWAADHNMIYCYDARGARFLKIQLPRRLLLGAA